MPTQGQLSTPPVRHRRAVRPRRMRPRRLNRRDLQRSPNGRAVAWQVLHSWVCCWRWLQAERPSEARMSRSVALWNRQQTVHSGQPDAPWRGHRWRIGADQDRGAASLVRRAGRCGRSGPPAWFRDSSAGLDRSMADRDHGQCEPWRRPGSARLAAVAHTGSFRCAFSRYVYEHRIFGESPRDPQYRSPRTVIIFWVVAAMAGLFFVVAVALMASAPWVLLQPDHKVRTELNRWFLTVAWHRRSGRRDADPGFGS